ncbi:related to SPN1 - Spt6-interacting putative elongation factor [Melanopsichium pennsylvanicum]|uniref:Related to SPN1 - Spt6-interacting putative elongation factor n=2 Tax=Melanopsichium pennsylvanicum TaxID=63383 RepID=A0AAJ4XMX9_9BASI|nr:related to SPN1-Spt6-interacting putative elongation factor [Melanopsichium pennsylvanicum 4]SNX85207.1 related to SPN1 - Spt6-interacting putative elongation factor [Melanopsichium pennsylvanicum]
MADEEQQVAQTFPQEQAHLVAEPTQPITSTQERDGEQPAATAGEVEGSIENAPPTDPKHLTTVVRGEDTGVAATSTAAIFDEDDDEEQDQDDDLPNFRKREQREASNADDPEAAIIRKKKKKRHLSPNDEATTLHDVGVEREEHEEEQEDPYAGLTEVEARRLRTDQMIDAALKAGKKKAASRKRAGEDDLDLLADEEVAALRREMVAAADDDEEANRLKKPATNKLKLLPRVVATLQKNHLQQSILDNNLLEGVKRWLEPLPDKSLPALNIQHQFFQILERMTIDTISLKMSGLGKVVVFYSMCSRVEAKIKRSAEHLIEIWSRPVLKRSSSYRDRHVAKAEWNADAFGQRVMIATGEVKDSGRRNVGIPQSVVAGFRVAPQSVAGQRSDSSHEARLANHKRLNQFKSRLKEAKR